MKKIKIENSLKKIESLNLDVQNVYKLASLSSKEQAKQLIADKTTSILKSMDDIHSKKEAIIILEKATNIIAKLVNIQIMEEDIKARQMPEASYNELTDQFEVSAPAREEQKEELNNEDQTVSQTI